MLGSPEAEERERQRLWAVREEIWDWESCASKLEVTERTTWRWRSFSVLWLYHGSSLSGDHCQAYFRTVLITALLMRMHRYTMRKAFIDLQGHRGEIRKRTQEKYQSPKKTTNLNHAVEAARKLILLFYSRALLRFRLVIKRHLGLHTSVDCNSWGRKKKHVNRTRSLCFNF